MSARTVAVLGLGSIGRRHARNLAQLGHRVLGFDTSAEACRRFVAETGGEAVDRQVALRADAVVIASPNRFHLPDLKDAIDAGRPALVEKPLGVDAEVAEALISRAQRSGLVIAVAQNLRFRAIVLRARVLLREGKIGRPLWASFESASYLPDWRPEQDYRLNYTADPATGGVIFDSIHEIDLAVHLLGPAEVRGCVAQHTGLLEIASEDLADIVMHHAGGCQSRIHLDYVTRPRRRHFTIAGSQGVLSADLRGGSLSLVGLDNEPLLTEVIGLEVNQEYIATMEDFLRAAGGGAAPSCTASEAVDVLYLACAARRLAGLPGTASA